MKKVLLVIGAVVLALVLVAVYRGFTVFVDQQYQVSTPLQKIQVDETAALQRFSQAIKLPTISYDDRSHFDEAAFIAFHQHLQDSFPLVQQHAERSIIAGFSLVYHLKGQDPSLNPRSSWGTWT